MTEFFPPTSFWLTMLSLCLIGILTYLFGVWDAIGNRMSMRAGGAFLVVAACCLAAVILIAAGMVITYFSMAYCHKWFGPIVFGG